MRRCRVTARKETLVPTVPGCEICGLGEVLLLRIRDMTDEVAFGSREFVEGGHQVSGQLWVGAEEQNKVQTRYSKPVRHV
ncbi:MAG: hypothetical protein QHJ82_03690 [Verrucomicrobiota bacterium]|nr:hypothetical protein [Verrucomicrobiota bacterium]